MNHQCMSRDNEEWPGIESSSFVLFGGTCRVVKNMSILMMIVSEKIIPWDHSCFDEHPIHAEECHAVRVLCIIIYISEHVSMLHNVQYQEVAKRTSQKLLEWPLIYLSARKWKGAPQVWYESVLLYILDCQACGIISHHGKDSFKNHMPDEVQYCRLMRFALGAKTNVVHVHKTSKLHYAWYLVLPLLIVLLKTNYKPWCSVTNTKR